MKHLIQFESFFSSKEKPNIYISLSNKEKLPIKFWSAKAQFNLIEDDGAVPVIITCKRIDDGLFGKDEFRIIVNYNINTNKLIGSITFPDFEKYEAKNLIISEEEKIKIEKYLKPIIIADKNYTYAKN